MIDKLDIICKAEYLLIDDIISFDQLSDNEVSIEGDFTLLDIILSENTTASYTTNESLSGTIHKLSGSIRLNADFNEKKSLILKLTYESGEAVVVGSPNQFVSISTNSNRDVKSMSFTFESHKKPLVIV